MQGSTRSRATFAALLAALLAMDAGCGSEAPPAADAAPDQNALPDAAAPDLLPPDAAAADLAPDTRPPPCEGQPDARYPIDPQRRYASGFSNGTAMALELFGDAQAQLSGCGVVGGGIWQQRGLSWGGEGGAVLTFQR